MSETTAPHPTAKLAISEAEWRAVRIRAAAAGLSVAAYLAQIVKRELNEPAPETEV